MTAKEFLRNKKNEIGLRSQSSPLGSEGTEIEAMIEFAKYHVEQALKKAAFNSQVEVVDHEPLSEMAKKAELLPIYGVDESSIVNAYPLENIK